MKLPSLIKRIFTLGLIMAFALPLAAKPGPLPSWITPPPPGSINTQALVTLQNPITGETYTVPTGGYTVNISDSDAQQPGIGGPDPRPEVERPDPRVEEYRKLEKWLEGHKAEEAKAERDLEVKIAELRKKVGGDFDENEAEFAIKKARSEHDAAMAGHAEERKNLESRMAELIKIPEVVICIFPPRPEPRPFPPHWGRPPAIQTKDLRPLPEGFEGMGSSTLCAWIERNVKSDLANKDKPKPEPKRPPVVRPPEPPRPELSDDAKAELTGIKSEKKALMEEMKAKLAELDEGASREDTRKAVEEFKKDNEARFAAIKEATDALIKQLERPERKSRPAPPLAVKERIAEVKKVEKTMHVARKTVTDKLKEAQDELAAKIAEAKKNPDKREVEIHVKNLVAEQAAARKAALEEFRAAQKVKHEELKTAQKELREEVRNTKEEGSSRTSR